MKQLIPNLDVDLLIENGGHQMKLTGSGMSFTASFLTLRSLLHFLWALRKSQNLIPSQASLQLQWRGISIPVKTQ